MSDAYDEVSTNPFDALTERERQVAENLALGAKNGEIANIMNVSVKTVDSHRAHVLKKLGCRNNVELCRLAIRQGLTPL